MVGGKTMADTVTLLDPQKLHRNEDNPRLIFRQDELDQLQESIKTQGILVPLTIFKDGAKYFLLDGERRWRCSLKLGLSNVPVILQPKPNRLQNLMMMFAIHNARRDWDPLPTALKLLDLEKEFKRRNGRNPTEAELAGLASLSRGVVRRLKKLLSLPEQYRKELLSELKKPRSEQEITVDHVLEVTKAAEVLRKRNIIDSKKEDHLRQALISKFRTKVLRNTVEPRMLARVARAVERKELTNRSAADAVERLIKDAEYSISDAFRDTVEKQDFEHSTVQLTERLTARLESHLTRSFQPTESLKASLLKLQSLIKKLLG